MQYFCLSRIVFLQGRVFRIKEIKADIGVRQYISPKSSVFVPQVINLFLCSNKNTEAVSCNTFGYRTRLFSLPNKPVISNRTNFTPHHLNNITTVSKITFRFLNRDLFGIYSRFILNLSRITSFI